MRRSRKGLAGKGLQVHQDLRHINKNRKNHGPSSEARRTARIQRAVRQMSLDFGWLSASARAQMPANTQMAVATTTTSTGMHTLQANTWR